MSKNSVSYNKESFINYMEDKLSSGLVSIDDKFIAVKDNNSNKLNFVIDRQDGSYVGSTAGKNKSNGRSYINVDLGNGSIMLANYWVVAYLKYREDEGLVEDWVNGADINHINGDTQYNNPENLEIVSKSINMIHSRLMSDIHKFYPNIVTEDEDCQGNKKHKFIGVKGISGKQIQRWNETHSKEEQLTAKVSKTGVFRCGYTKHFIDQIITKFKLDDYYDFEGGVIK